MDERDPAGPWKHAWTRAWLDEYVSANGKNLASMAQDPEHAVRDVVHGVVARNPRMRYLSGTLAKTLFFALWKMPERWSFLAKKATIASGSTSLFIVGGMLEQPRESRRSFRGGCCDRHR
jgi:hypothetical protein